MDHLTVTQLLVATVLLGQALTFVASFTGRWRRWLNREVNNAVKIGQQNKDSLGRIESQMLPNGGNSLADRMARMETSVRGLDRKLTDHMKESKRNEHG